jgi:hypothetical protein
VPISDNVIVNVSFTSNLTTHRSIPDVTEIPSTCHPDNVNAVAPATVMRLPNDSDVLAGPCLLTAADPSTRTLDVVGSALLGQVSHYPVDCDWRT